MMFLQVRAFKTIHLALDLFGAKAPDGQKTAVAFLFIDKAVRTMVKTRRFGFPELPAKRFRGLLRVAGALRALPAAIMAFFQEFDDRPFGYPLMPAGRRTGFQFPLLDPVEDGKTRDVTYSRGFSGS
jgi:hypothetical protein